MMQLVRGNSSDSCISSDKVRLSYLRKAKTTRQKEPRKGHRGFKKSDDGQMSDESRTDQRQNVLRGWNPKGLAH